MLPALMTRLRPAFTTTVPVPVVYAYAPSQDSRDVSLTPDNVEGGRLAIEHLVACGRRRIAHVSSKAACATSS